MKVSLSVSLLGLWALAACVSLSPGQSSAISAADATPQDDKAVPPASRAIHNRVTIEVTGGDKNAAIVNASVYVKYIQEHVIKRDKKIEMNVKTNEQGIAHVPDPPLGRALIQVIADGWKPYGRWYDIADSNQVIKVHLDRPPKWY